jgi:hypothetical protein
MFGSEEGIGPIVGLLTRSMKAQPVSGVTITSAKIRNNLDRISRVMPVFIWLQG